MSSKVEKNPAKQGGIPRKVWACLILIQIGYYKQKKMMCKKENSTSRESKDSSNKKNTITCEERWKILKFQYDIKSGLRTRKRSYENFKSFGDYTDFYEPLPILKSKEKNNCGQFDRFLRKI